jgi:hypothetical protein
MKFEQKRMKTPCPIAPGLRASVSRRQNFTKYPQISQTVCGEGNMSTDEGSTLATQKKAQIKNSISVGVLMGFYISRAN